MTRIDCLSEIEQAKEKGIAASLYSAIIFFVSPITGQLEVRKAWFEDMNELRGWTGHYEHFYSTHGIAYQTHINGEMDRQYKDISLAKGFYADEPEKT